MLLTLKVFTVLLDAETMNLALAHALELPGKLRLDERTYLFVQTIAIQASQLAAPLNHWLCSPRWGSC